MDLMPQRHFTESRLDMVLKQNAPTDHGCHPSAPDNAFEAPQARMTRSRKHRAGKHCSGAPCVPTGMNMGV